MDKILAIIHKYFFSLTEEIQDGYCKVFEKC